MTCHHIGLELLAKSNSKCHGVEEDCGLSDAGLFQLLVGATEHNLRYLEAENLVCFVE